MAIPSGITLWMSIKLIYELAEPNIWALDTQDEDMTQGSPLRKTSGMYTAISLATSFDA